QPLLFYVYNVSKHKYELIYVTEGVAKNFTCSVYHSCQKEPTITWNYENMPITKGSKTRSDLNQVTYSDITFLGAKEDHGKKLTCTANFSGGNIITSVVLCIQCDLNVTFGPITRFQFNSRWLHDLAKNYFAIIYIILHFSATAFHLICKCFIVKQKIKIFALTLYI
uniref:Si:dkey-238d18.13 n=1 Tax=Cyprinus carpio carpio TaxID=630221 RepID=A0A9J7YBP9_CYPCA